MREIDVGLLEHQQRVQKSGDAFPQFRRPPARPLDDRRPPCPPRRQHAVDDGQSRERHDEHQHRPVQQRRHRVLAHEKSCTNEADGAAREPSKTIHGEYRSRARRGVAAEPAYSHQYATCIRACGRRHDGADEAAGEMPREHAMERHVRAADAGDEELLPVARLCYAIEREQQRRGEEQRQADVRELIDDQTETDAVGEPDENAKRQRRRASTRRTVGDRLQYSNRCKLTNRS